MAQVPIVSLKLSLSVVTASMALTLICGRANAADPLGLYVGASLGEAHIRAKDGLVTRIENDPGPGYVQYDDSGSLSRSHTAFKVVAGIRPLPLLGAEVSYLDFGKASGPFNEYPGTVSEKGASAFALLYLPVPLVDVFVKGGMAAIRSDIRGTPVFSCSAICPFIPVDFVPSPFRIARTDTSGAYGAGAQFRWGAFGLRAEYERFHAASAHPDLLSVGATWTF